MHESALIDFLSSYDESRFPDGFLQTYEPVECLADNTACESETLLVKHRQTGVYFVAKCYSGSSLSSHTTESELLRGLHHTGLPCFVDEYRNKEMLCVVREYVQGVPLDKLVQESPLAEKQIISVGIQLCDILIYLHGQTPPIVHRDIKPQNIIAGEDGSIKLIDFGISRVYNENGLTDTVIFGTQEFAAPEQYGFSQTDSRSDIFSLGVLLCWLLTGETKAEKALKSIKSKRLASIIKKCTAFAPEDRYRNAPSVKYALTGRNIRRKVTAALCVTVTIALTVFLILYSSENLPGQKATGIKFEEPLIEQAVRLALSKNEDEKISEDELLSLKDLYVFGNKAAANEEMYKTYSDSFVANDGTVSRGSIRSLNDVTRLKNLCRLYLSYQNINDLTPLSQLEYLECVELKHNPIKDISPLSQLESLNMLLIFDTKVTDLTALGSCPRLTVIDAGYTLITSMAALDGLDSLKVLLIRKAPLKTLDNIASHPVLEQIYLSETHLSDLGQLLDLPDLQLVELSEDMQEPAKAITDKARFKIIYQK